MSIKAGQKIKASDINALNKDYVTYSNSFKGKSFSSTEWDIPASFAPKTDGQMNVQISFDTNSSSDKCDLEIWNSAKNYQYLEWDINETSPGLNVDNWDFEWDSSASYPRSVSVPEGSYVVKVGLAAVLFKPEAKIRFMQGETGIVAGDRIALWKSDFSALEPEFGNTPKATYAAKGRFGTREVD